MNKYSVTSSELAYAIALKPMKIPCEKAGVDYANSHFSMNAFLKIYRLYVGLAFLCNVGKIWFAIKQIWVHCRTNNSSKNTGTI